MLYWFLPHISVNQPWVCVSAPSGASPPPATMSWSAGLAHTAGSNRLPASHLLMRVFLCQLVPPLLPLPCPQVCSLCLRLRCCPADRFISTIFLDSLCVCFNILLFDLPLHSVQWALALFTAVALTQNAARLWLSDAPLHLYATALCSSVRVSQVVSMSQP